MYFSLNDTVNVDKHFVDFLIFSKSSFASASKYIRLISWTRCIQLFTNLQVWFISIQLAPVSQYHHSVKFLNWKSRTRILYIVKATLLFS